MLILRFSSHLRLSLGALYAYFLLAGSMMCASEPEETRRLTFGMLAACPLLFAVPAGSVDQGQWRSNLSPEIRAAEGQSVVITGYVLPLKIEAGRTRQFMLMRDQSACCYGKPPAASEYLVATAPVKSPGIVASMDVPVTIRGTLRIEPQIYDGVVTQFYTLADSARVGP